MNVVEGLIDCRAAGGPYSPYMEDSRYLLAFGADAERITRAPGVSVLRRLRDVVIVEVERSQAVELADGADYVYVYRSPTDALLALSVFEQ